MSSQINVGEDSHHQLQCCCICAAVCRIVLRPLCTLCCLKTDLMISHQWRWVTVVSALLSVCSWLWLYCGVWGSRPVACCTSHALMAHCTALSLNLYSTLPHSAATAPPLNSKPSLLRRSNAIHAYHPVWLVLLLCERNTHIATSKYASAIS